MLDKECSSTVYVGWEQTALSVKIYFNQPFLGTEVDTL